jgi:hypothetical protein
MALRVARGLFRLWIVGTALFVLFIAFVGYSGIQAEFDAASVRAPDKDSAVAAVDFRNPPPPGFVIAFSRRPA